jgi:cyclophilin family peptidyl-prolyl cis-trans isomerase/HEAT repeat protein
MLANKLFSRILPAIFLATSLSAAFAQNRLPKNIQPAVPPGVLLKIIRHEDERRWDTELSTLVADKDARVRKRAALAAGRIGDERAVPVLIDVLRSDQPGDVRQMAAFALGEIESPLGAKVLIVLLENTREQPVVRARAVEALGKIGENMLRNLPAQNAKVPDATEGAGLVEVRKAIIDALSFESGRRSAPDRETILLGLTAALRAKPENAGAVVVRFLHYSDPRIVADALNTLARLRLKDGNDAARDLLVKHSDPIVRAKAASVLGATEDKQAFDALLDRALHDEDLRVRVNAIRALGSLKDARAALSLAQRANELMKPSNLRGAKVELRNEVLEVISALGAILTGRLDDTGISRMLTKEEFPLETEIFQLSFSFPPGNGQVLEYEIAHARIRPREYFSLQEQFEAVADKFPHKLSNAVFAFSSIAARAAGLAEVGRLKPPPSSEITKGARLLLRRMLVKPYTPVLAIPNILNAYAVYKPGDLGELLREYLKQSDVITRATAAELLGEQPQTEANTRALIEALPRALQDKDLNDAALSILDALGKQKSNEANDAIKSALGSSDHLIRRRAVALLKANGVGDFSDRIGTVQTRNTDADYRRAISRIGRRSTATVVTSRGSFTIEFLPEDAPLTVDNFIQLARKGYFNGQTIPRVVPNFVVQAGDPRGDTNGGPGYSIRCEMNEVPYERAAVGMALSGKDTGGSQWFVTHSPQPHLDGGYTVFGHVISGMEVVDKIVRGDTIRRVVINER